MKNGLQLTCNRNKGRTKLERVFRQTKSADDAKRFKEHSNHYCQLLITTRQEFYHNKIQSCAGDQKAVVNVLNKLLHCNSETQLPVHDFNMELANKCANFLIDKIDGICDGLGGTCLSTFVSDDVNICSTKLDNLTSVNGQDDVGQFIQSAKTKSSSLDPIPTCILKLHLPHFRQLSQDHQYVIE